MTPRARMLHDLGWVAGGSWANRLILVVVLAVLTSQLEPRQFGLLTVAALVSNLLIVLNDAGLAEALVYYQRRHLREAANTTFLVTIVIGAALAVLIIVAAPMAARFLHAPDAVGVIRAYAPMVWANAAQSAPLALLTHQMEFRRRFVPETVPSIVGGAITVALAFAGAGVWSLVIGDAVRSILSLVLSLVVLDERLWPRWSRPRAAELWSYARGSFPSKINDFALQNIDYLLVGRLLGPVALGYYTVAFRLAILPFLTITFVLIGIAFPALARLMPDLPRARRMSELTYRLGLAAVGAAAGALVVLAQFLVLLGPKWAPAVPTTRLLAVYVFLRSGAYLLAPVLNAVGRPGIVAALRGLWVVLLAGTVAATGTSIEAIGFAQVVVAAALLAAHTIAARRLAGVPLGPVVRDLARPAVASAAAGAVVLVLRSSFPLVATDSSFPALVLLGVAFLAVYVAVLTVIAPDLRRDIAQLRNHDDVVETGPATALAAMESGLVPPHSPPGTGEPGTR